jgi:hypothetical protein
MACANRYSLTTSLPTCKFCVPFIYSSCLIALVRYSKSMLNMSGESEHTFLLHDFRGNGFSVSPLSMMLAIGLSYIAFIMLRFIASITSLIRALIMKWCSVL